MMFREKIDKILKDNTLGINTVYGLEAFIGASPGAISKPLNKADVPGPGTIKKIRDGLPGLNPEWWDTGKGEVFLKNGTYVELPKGSPENEEVYRNIVEGNTEYILIPRSVLQEKYRLVALEQFEKDKEQMDKDKKIIDRLLSINEKLMNAMASLEPKATEVQKAE